VLRPLAALTRIIRRTPPCPSCGRPVPDHSVKCRAEIRLPAGDPGLRVDRRDVRATRIAGDLIGLSVILIAAVALRGYWVIQHATVLEGNGCEYVRIAENLIKHGAYVGLYEGPELMFPPFFPISLALGSLLTGSVDSAARLVPVISGVLLVPAVFTLARLMYSPRVALFAAALIAFHPLLIDLSSVALSEGTYLLLMVMALYWGLRSLDSGRPGHTVWCGAILGLACLTRPEAVFYPFVILAAALLKDLRQPAFVKRFALRALCLLAPIVVLVAPYVLYESVHAGSLRLEGKALINYTIGVRISSGMSAYEAATGIGPDLSEGGPQLSPNTFVATNKRKVSLRELFDYWIASAERNKAPLLYQLLISPVFGSVLAIALITLGLLRRPWTQRRAQHESVLLGVAMGHLLLLLGVHFINSRYLLPLVPLSLLWVAQGIDGAARWGVGTAGRCGLPTRRVHTAIHCVLIVAVVLLAAWGLRWGSLQDQNPRTLLLKDVRAWLGEYHPGPKRVMTDDIRIPYYSGGTFLQMPYADAALALRYVHQKHPDFIVLVGGEPYLAPYLEQWLREGIPDRAAKLIYRAGPASPAVVMIYEWQDLEH